MDGRFTLKTLSKQSYYPNLLLVVLVLTFQLFFQIHWERERERERMMMTVECVYNMRELSTDNLIIMKRKIYNQMFLCQYHAYYQWWCNCYIWLMIYLNIVIFQFNIWWKYTYKRQHVSYNIQIWTRYCPDLLTIQTHMTMSLIA